MRPASPVSSRQIFGRGQIVTGVGMLAGSVIGGYVAQVTSLGVPFVMRAAVLVLMFFFAAWAMKDIGFTPRRGENTVSEMKKITADSIDYGWRVPSVKWIMLAAPFTAGVGFYAFYALQPYLLELVGDPTAYGIAGITAALVAGVADHWRFPRPANPAALPAADLGPAACGRGRAR